MHIAGGKNSPLIMTTNDEEWMYVLAPRIDEDATKSFPIIFPKLKEFNPLTGEFE